MNKTKRLNEINNLLAGSSFEVFRLGKKDHWVLDYEGETVKHFTGVDGLDQIENWIKGSNNCFSCEVYFFPVPIEWD